MSNKINFPTLLENKNAQIVFVRKYRQMGKTRYIFLKANIHKKVSNEIKEWLKERIKKVDGKTYENYNQSPHFKDFEHVDLNLIDKWKDFNSKAFSISTQEDFNLEQIKKGLTAFIVYIKQGKDIIGYLRRVNKSNILNREGFFTIFLKDSAFNEIKEDNAVRIDKYADLIFYKNDQSAFGIIIDKKSFFVIFDIKTQQKKEAMSLLNKCSILKSNPNFDQIKDIFSNDRQLQIMLINPAVKDNLDELDINTIKKFKEELPQMPFSVNSSNQIIFENGKEKDCVREIIKLFGKKYNRTFDLKHIMEGTPHKIIK